LKRNLTFFAALAALSVCVLFAQAPGKSDPLPDPWAGLRFLLGNWDAKTIGGSAHAQSSGDYTFEFDLGGHILARRTAPAACKGPKDFDCQHSDLLYIYPASTAATWKAIYFDSEGHVINYEVTTPRPGMAVFLSGAGPQQPQFRLIYEQVDGELTGKFQAKMPGNSEFVSYLEWSGKQNNL
jgi:hypothetical protein